jgi:hypothetical protein
MTTDQKRAPGPAPRTTLHVQDQAPWICNSQTTPYRLPAVMQ